MKPWLPHHVYTSVHREFGGLPYLELVRAACEKIRQTKATGTISIVCIGSERIATVLCALQYQVTVVGTGAAIERIKQDVEDANLVCHFASEIPPDTEFDLALIEGESAFEQNLPAKKILGRCISKTLAQGQFFFKEKNLQLEEVSPLQTRITAAIAKSQSALIHAHPKRFHILDFVLSFIAHHASLHGMTDWFFVARPCDAKKPLVMHVMPTLGAGGAERVVFDIAQNLPQKGYEIETVSIIRGGEMLQTFVDAGLHVRVLFRRGLAGISAVRSLWRVMRIMKPSIVHTHLFGADIWGGVAAKLAGIRVLISTEHSINKDYTAKHLFLKRRAVRLFSQFVAVSTESEQYLHAVQGVPPGKVSIVRNGIDMKRIMMRGAHPFATEPKLIIVARLIPSKGHRTLFEALAKLMALPWRLQIVGNGPDEQALRAEAERLGILSRLEWLGYRTDVPELLSRADLFCFPSEWEGLGLALIEAAATGIPIITSDLPALREVMDEEVATFVALGDIEGWSQAIRKCISLQEQMIQRAMHAAPSIQQRFSVERMAVGYAAVYRRMLSL